MCANTFCCIIEKLSCAVVHTDFIPFECRVINITASDDFKTWIRAHRLSYLLNTLKHIYGMSVEQYRSTLKLIIIGDP